MTLRERQIKEKACTVCSGVLPLSNTGRYSTVSLKRCFDCVEGSNFKTRPISFIKPVRKKKTLRRKQVKDKACTVCNGIIPWGKGYRAVNKKRCDTCGDRKINFKEGKL